MHSRTQEASMVNTAFLADDNLIVREGVKALLERSANAIEVPES